MPTTNCTGMTEERIARLEEIGFEWSVSDRSAMGFTLRGTEAIQGKVWNLPCPSSQGMGHTNNLQTGLVSNGQGIHSS